MSTPFGSPQSNAASSWLGPAWAALAILVVAAAPADADAAGFEIPENTAESLARGGTGAVLKSDPSALYFNPALLTRSRGFQAKLDGNLVDLDLQFQRAPLTYRKNNETRRQTFDPVSNQAGPFPVPFFAASWDLNTDNFVVGLGAFGPPAYGRRCFGRLEDGECRADRDGAARHMMIESQLLQVYPTVGAAYRFELRDDSYLSIGASAMLAYQNNSFKLAINSEIPPSRPWEEDPEQEAIFTARNLNSWNFTGMLGISWEARNGLRLAASYRPPLHWESTGTAEVDFADNLEESDLGLQLSDDKVTFRSHQAGKLRFGAGYEHGVHPGDEKAPEFSLELNAVWEDWGRVDFFELDPAGDITAEGIGDANFPELHPIMQRKGYRDTFSLRAGGSWGATSWLTVHGGAYFETPAQPNSYTSVDFVSWERYAGTLGASFHAADWIDIDLAYAHVFSPSRNVRDGQVYNLVPLSSCRGPNFDQDACSRPGRPPGNPQNNGEWSANVDMASAGVTLKFD